MEIHAPFQLHENFWAIADCRKMVWVKCEFCASDGFIIGADGSSEDCPVCSGRMGRHEVLPRKWRVIDYGVGPEVDSPRGQMLTVGVVRAEVREAQRDECEYMALETGLSGVGRWYHMDDCFGTLEEAITACEERNAQ